MAGRALEDVLEAVAALDPGRVRAHAATQLTVFAPFDAVAEPGHPGSTVDDALEVAFAELAAWAGGPPALTARLVDGDRALGEYERPGDAAPLTVVVGGDGHGRVRDLRLYLDVGPGGDA